MSKNDNLLSTVNRALALLEYVANSREGLSLTEISERLNLPKSSVVRYLNTLEQKQYLERDPYSQRYFLGSAPLRLVSRDARQGDIRRAAYPIMLQLRESSAETINLTVPMKDKVVYVETLQSSHPVRTVRQIGEESPLHSTAVGKAVLAWLPPERIENLKSRALEQYTERTITVWPSLLRELEKIRDQGYAIDDREGHREFRCVGAPIFDHRSRVVASIAVSAPATRLSLEQAIDLGPEVRDAAMKISYRLGYGLDKQEQAPSDFHIESDENDDREEKEPA